MPTQQVDSSVGHQPAVVRPLPFGPVGFFLPGLAGLESLTKRMADESQDAIKHGQWRDEARRAAQDVARLVARRSPETVARMERERGLA